MEVKKINYKTHIVGGLALGFVAFNNIDILGVDINVSRNLAIASGGLIFGSLFPDIDKHNSYLSKRVKPISMITSKVLKHREFTHSIAGTLILSLLMNIILNNLNLNINTIKILSLSFTIGIISHIFLDMFTPAGVVLFYPIYKKKVRFGGFILSSKRFSIMEVIVIICLAILAFANFKK